MAKKKRVDRTKNYCRYRKLDPKKCAKGSFRVKQVSKNVKITVCCPKGKYSKKAKRCRVGLKTQSFMKKHHGRKCPIR